MLRTALFTVALVCAPALAGCVDDDYTFNGTDNPLDSSAGDSGDAEVAVDTRPGDGGCVTNLDCAGDLSAPICNTLTGQCVECVTSERCKGRSVCKNNACVEVACTDNSHCTSSTGDAGVDADNPDATFAALTCDTTTNMCVGCKIDDHCPAGFVCTTSDGVCRPGCSATHACQAGRDCCSGKCLDTTADVANCGACGSACPTPANTTMKCEKDATTMKGVCKVASCTTGWADCNASTSGGAADGCETDIFTKVDSCGGCGTACTIANGSGVCEGGMCKVATCNTGFGNCDGLHTNGCEQTLNTTTHCGGCGTACAPANAAGDCSTGTCKVGTCNTGFGNCDTADGNGCEINLQTSAANCNACGNVCPSTSGTPACVAGACRFSTCAAGLGDCAGTGTCGTTLINNVNHCGACGRACVAANGTPACTGTSCSIASCSAGYGDCNTSYIDGCETKLDTLSNCGGCGTSCSRANATATCAAGSCAINTCAAGFGNCDSIDSNGCEKAVTNDVNNCGACGRVCNVTNGTGSCTGTTCGVASCNAGFANCDTNTADCERNLSAASNTCATAQALTDASASTTFCSTKTTETATASVTSSRFYKVHLERCDGGPCRTNDAPRARISLTNPAGLAYDLIVYGATSCGTPLTTITGTAATTHTYNFVPGGDCNTARDAVIEVRYRSGSSCTAPTLTVTSAYFPYP